MKNYLFLCMAFQAFSMNAEAAAQLHWDISTPPSPLSASTRGFVSPIAHHVVPTRENTASMGERSATDVSGAPSVHSASVASTGSEK